MKRMLVLLAVLVAALAAVAPVAFAGSWGWTNSSVAAGITKQVNDRERFSGLSARATGVRCSKETPSTFFCVGNLAGTQFSWYATVRQSDGFLSWRGMR
jgi:hypothetical protein